MNNHVSDFDRYVAACNYDQPPNEAEVERQLALYFKALGVQRKIKRLPRGWRLDTEPDLHAYVLDVIKRSGPSSSHAVQ